LKSGAHAKKETAEAVSFSLAGCFALHGRSRLVLLVLDTLENEDGDIFEVADPRGEFEQKVISEMQITAFAEQSISEKDREILKLRMEGYTEQEIADKVGYKTASAVHKRIAKIANAYEDYVTAEYQKYLDK
jgi:DNA-binding NarL/FixJ family response regulator